MRWLLYYCLLYCAQLSMLCHLESFMTASIPLMATALSQLASFLRISTVCRPITTLWLTPLLFHYYHAPRAGCFVSYFLPCDYAPRVSVCYITYACVCVCHCEEGVWRIYLNIYCRTRARSKMHPNWDTAGEGRGKVLCINKLKPKL